MQGDILFELGLILFLGFLVGYIMKRIGHSVIIGYMVIGLVIGPNVLGLVKHIEFLETLSELGIVFLMFFLGLEFSINKFKEIKNTVFFIGTFEVVMNFGIGLILGFFLKLIWKEAFFLAAIVAISSSGVVAKLLFDLKRTGHRESEVHMGIMVLEDFYAMFILGILSSFATYKEIQFADISIAAFKAIAFYAIIILIGIFILNKVMDFLAAIESQELFTAFMLGSILLIGALALKIGLASAAGAFLFGMIISSYDVERRLHKNVSAFKDIFLIIFFISFGMLLNPMEIPGVLWMILIVVPISIIAEIFFTTSSAIVAGFTSSEAFSIGTSMLSRGEYSLVFAALGIASGAIPESLYQFAGVYVFIMTLVSPIALKHSDKIRNSVSKITPKFIKNGFFKIAAKTGPFFNK